MEQFKSTHGADDHPVMIAADAALALVRAHTPTLPARDVALDAAAGAVAAATVRAPGPLQPFDNSAMDGYAVRAGELAGATDADPVRLPLRGHTAAGPVVAERAPDTPGAWEIMTGAPVPAGFDAVVPVERTARDGDAVVFTAPPEAGANIRRAGEDYAAGDPVVDAGDWLTPERMMALHAHGVATLAVRRAPRVAVIATGAELVSDPGRALRPGEIRDSNRPYLVDWLRAAGITVSHAVTVGDDPAVFARELDAALATGPDVVLTSGAVSAGVHDFIPAALLAAGATIRFHKAQIRPAKPLLFATLPGGAACFGLPGNPLSVAVGLRFFATACLRTLWGLPPERFARARLANAWRKPEAMTFYGKGRINTDDDGRLVATMLDGQQSFRIRPLTQANGWIVLPPGEHEVAAGRVVEVASLDADWRR